MTFPDHTPTLPNALDTDALSSRLDGRMPAVFLDYDGTLTPIVEHPEDAHLADASRSALIRLAQLCPVAIVSGRDMPDVRGMVAVDDLIYAGSHGWDIDGPDIRVEYRGDEFLPLLDDAEDDLRQRADAVTGARVERKRFAIAVHYRQVPDDHVPRIEEAVRSVATTRPKLRVTGGKKILELRPALEWHKGTAVNWLLDTLGLTGDEVVPMYLGDDETDEDAFRALPGHGIGIVVAPEHQTAADYVLADADQVREFLEMLADMLAGRRTKE